MATGSAAGDEPTLLGRLPSVRTAGQTLLRSLVFAPGRSAAVLLVALPYLWLGYYVVGVAAGRVGDPIIAGDWLTLMFTSYALVSSLALAHRILQTGRFGLSESYLVDVVVLVWLTTFYFVWMLAREAVSATTTVVELYAPVLHGEPTAVVWAAATVLTTAVAAGVVVHPREGSKLFAGEFRTALVTLPATVTALTLLVRPGGDSLLWPVLIGLFLGTLLGGLIRIHIVASAASKGVFAALSLFVWAFGTLLWVLIHRRRPPNWRVVLTHVAFGTTDRNADSTDRDTDGTIVQERQNRPGDTPAMSSDGGDPTRD
ncbi:uncharacterized protein NP_2150A [Natronomonas pharaonis DSM 2160]|uniref:Uncharacterized protein n=1 Tax=Natronomonas pharaonis (strain ATCC 35678 / DSM 2160 / CIP 103997 / JCM 8858 / NBRC 14720 / NCIMB 2260 / Gabara) TaxID=348780 RepID=A0A1U7EVS5_NATPD|nr:hypothetical protein [Natronomonas pharaonis]CAI49166.1 uncharacterized protein NP_2150A [Natronomonas pharaonis DSM 2160]